MWCIIISYLHKHVNMGTENLIYWSYMSKTTNHIRDTYYDSLLELLLPQVPLLSPPLPFPKKHIQSFSPFPFPHSPLFPPLQPSLYVPKAFFNATPSWGKPERVAITFTHVGVPHADNRVIIQPDYNGYTRIGYASHWNHELAVYVWAARHLLKANLWHVAFNHRKVSECIHLKFMVSGQSNKPTNQQAYTHMCAMQSC